MTSPCDAVLTSSPTITLTPNCAAFAAASSAPEISLWSVTAIAPSPCSRAVASSTSTGVAQSWEWSVCMCRSTSIRGRAASRLRTAALPRPSWRRADQPAVDVLESRRRGAPRTASCAAARRRRAAAARSGASAISRCSCAAHVSHVARREQQAVVAFAGDLLVDGEARRQRHGAGGDRPQHQRRRRRHAVGRRHADVGVGQQLGLGDVVEEQDAVAQLVRAAASSPTARARDCTNASQSAPWSSRRSARRNTPQRGALLLLDEGDPHGRAVALARPTTSAPGVMTR